MMHVLHQYCDLLSPYGAVHADFIFLGNLTCMFICGNREKLLAETSVYIYILSSPQCCSALRAPELLYI